jgi:hypothetical protein
VSKHDHKLTSVRLLHGNDHDETGGVGWHVKTVLCGCGLGMWAPLSTIMLFVCACFTCHNVPLSAIMRFVGCVGSHAIMCH